jgi:hypothetical protein
MNAVSAYPLSWPAGRPRATARKASQFGRDYSPWTSGPTLTFGRARDHLLAELKRLGATKVILSTNIELRQDGLPYSGRRAPEDPGVAIYFQYKGKPMVFACDRWRKVEENAWAIAKTIDALRGIERWGSGDMLERAFTGFAALPNPETKKHWREVLGLMGRGHVPLHQLKERRDELAQEHHPDVGGSHERMAEINRAFDEAVRELEVAA